MVAERKPFLLRLDAETMAALRAWSADDLRSLNGQIEFLLRRALRDAGRLPTPAGRRSVPPGQGTRRAGPTSEPGLGPAEARRDHAD